LEWQYADILCVRLEKKAEEDLERQPVRERESIGIKWACLA
jgi:hypothetical protein